MVSDPARSPVTVGVNVIPRAHLELAATLEPQVLLAIAKSPATVTELIGRAAFN